MYWLSCASQHGFGLDRSNTVVYACNKFIAKQQTLQPARIYPKGRKSEESIPLILIIFIETVAASMEGYYVRSLVHSAVNDRNYNLQHDRLITSSLSRSSAGVGADTTKVRALNSRKP